MIISALKQSLKPYINQIEIKFKGLDVVKEIEYPTTEKFPAIYQDEIFNYLFITKIKLKPDTVIELSSYNVMLGKTTISTYLVKNILNELEGHDSILEKLAVGLKLKNDDSKLSTFK